MRLVGVVLGDSDNSRSLPTAVPTAFPTALVALGMALDRIWLEDHGGDRLVVVAVVAGLTGVFRSCPADASGDMG